MTTRERLDAIAARRILVLDGAMGSLIQSLGLAEADFRADRFADHPVPLKGCNDVLVLSKPAVISGIHEAYLAAGADITKTCSFTANAVSLADYGIGELAYEISAAAARLARKAAEQFSTPEQPRFVAGSIGPTTKSASLSPDVNDPARRGVYWDELEAAYYDNARGLLDGGADMLLVETVFDTLNAKAALFAIGRLLEERRGAANGGDVPVIVSATVSGESGRLLSGQTLEAFCESVLHAAPWAVGLNCSFGAEKMLHAARVLAAAAPCLVSAHPNAGLPNQLGGYDETPQTMAAHIERYLTEGLLNIVGGCCGSTPAHIAAIAKTAAQYRPRVCRQRSRQSRLAGLEPLVIGTPPAAKAAGALPLTIIGERTNVAGSKQFLRLISAGGYGEALAFARKMIADGAEILNVGMDDAMLDARQSMAAFLDLALSDPEIARVPVMIDSSRWEVIETGLKRLQGKGLVNSINLKDGEAAFLRRAALVRRYGAAVVVMLIDERGQAVSYERKIEIAGRAWRLLAGSGFPPEDIVFDPNVLAVATGLAEHDSAAIDFIRACSWIRDNCPGAGISGGISNLSFSFRGNRTVRRAMHSVFLKHAAAAGLTMAITEPPVAYNDIEENLRTAVEDVVLNRRPDAAERLLTLATQAMIATQVATNGQDEKVTHNGQGGADGDWRGLDAAARIVHAMVKGLDEHIEADALELRESGKSPLEIVEGPLMDGMKAVGRLFGEGKMYLPQVIRSARVMKKAVAALEPFMDRQNSAASAPVVILATVKGDVHDIGKNIVGVVLACNGCRIIDLGVMVPMEQIIETAVRERAAIIGLSGLISPSLDEMVHVAREMEQRRIQLPLLIGGAAASLVHTALRIAPEYSGPVVYVPDAGKSAEIVRALLSETERPRFLENLETSYREAARRHEAIHSRIEILPPAAARANRVPPPARAPVPPRITGLIDLNDYPLDQVIPYIDWPGFLREWNTHGVSDTCGVSGAAPDPLLDDAKAMLERVKAEGLPRLRGVVGIFPAAACDDDVVLTKAAGDGSAQIRRRFCFLRNQTRKSDGKYNPCLADFLVPAAAGDEPRDWLGLFALSAGFGLDAAADEFRRRNDDYSALLLATLANALTEAFAEAVYLRVRREWWGYAAAESLPIAAVLAGKYEGIRPAFGYPACPRHEDKRAAFELLEAEQRCGLALTETAMIVPAASICGMFFASPSAYYFGVGAAN